MCLGMSMSMSSGECCEVMKCPEIVLQTSFPMRTNKVCVEDTAWVFSAMSVCADCYASKWLLCMCLAELL